MEEYKQEEIKKDPKLDEVDLDKLRQSKYGDFFSVLIECGMINKQGIRISGLGMLNKKLFKMLKLQDKTNLNLYHIEKKLEH